MKGFDSYNFQRKLLRLDQRGVDAKQNFFFSTPHDEFCISGRNIWGKGLERGTYKPQNVFGHITHKWSTRVDESAPEGQNSAR